MTLLCLNMELSEVIKWNKKFQQSQAILIPIVPTKNTRTHTWYFYSQMKEL